MITGAEQVDRNNKVEFSLKRLGEEYYGIGEDRVRYQVVVSKPNGEGVSFQAMIYGDEIDLFENFLRQLCIVVGQGGFIYFVPPPEDDDELYFIDNFLCCQFYPYYRRSYWIIVPTDKTEDYYEVYTAPAQVFLIDEDESFINYIGRMDDVFNCLGIETRFLPMERLMKARVLEYNGKLDDFKGGRDFMRCWIHVAYQQVISLSIPLKYFLSAIELFIRFCSYFATYEKLFEHPYFKWIIKQIERVREEE